MLYFTKIKWAGEECILVTSSEGEVKKPVIILDRNDLKNLDKELNDKW